MLRTEEHVPMTATIRNVRALSYIPVVVCYSSAVCLYYIAWVHLLLLNTVIRVAVVSPVRLAQKSTAYSAHWVAAQASGRYWRKRRTQSEPVLHHATARNHYPGSTEVRSRGAVLSGPSQLLSNNEVKKRASSAHLPSLPHEITTPQQNREINNAPAKPLATQENVPIATHEIRPIATDEIPTNIETVSVATEDKLVFTVTEEEPKPITIATNPNPIATVQKSVDFEPQPEILNQHEILGTSVLHRLACYTQRCFWATYELFESVFTLSVSRGKLSASLFFGTLGLLFMFAQVHMSVLFGKRVLKVSTKTMTRYYTSMPLRAWSRLWGHLNALIIPPWLRTPIFLLYSTIYNVKVDEAAERDLQQYQNLSEFFQRSLRDGVRPVDDEALVTSPADGRVLHLGPVDDGVLEQVKGVTYTLSAFMGVAQPSNSSNLQAHENPTSENSKAPENSIPKHPKAPEDSKDPEYSTENSMKDGLSVEDLLQRKGTRMYQCIIYLAPGDYHRFHSPCDWTVMHRRHFPGTLLSVQPGVASWLRGLFCLNERAVYRGEWQHGFFAMAPVGAVNVGSINMLCDPELKTNTADSFVPGSYSDLDFPQGHALTKGQLVGDFNMGSTIVLLFEAPSDFEFCVQPGDKVKYGQKL